MGIAVEERKISIDEAMADSKEVFVTGTAAGVQPIESITHNGKTSIFPQSNDGGGLSINLRKTLKGIQYGAVEDRYGWMVPV